MFGVVAAAVVMRAARGTPEARAQAAAEKRAATGQPGGATTGFLPGGPQPGGQPGTAPPEEEKETLDAILPFVTEGGLAMILGLLLGMVTRAILKVFFVLAILAFFGFQFLAYKGIITVDWGAVKDFVLNIVPEGADLSTVVQRKLPSLGAFGLGYLLGLKRG